MTIYQSGSLHKSARQYYVASMVRTFEGLHSVSPRSLCTYRTPHPTNFASPRFQRLHSISTSTNTRVRLKFHYYWWANLFRFQDGRSYLCLLLPNVHVPIDVVRTVKCRRTVVQVSFLVGTIIGSNLVAAGKGWRVKQSLDFIDT
jgi:hypothetical protein